MVRTSIVALALLLVLGAVACGRGEAATKTSAASSASAIASSNASANTNESANTNTSVSANASANGCAPLAAPPLPELPSMGDDAPVPDIAMASSLAPWFERFAALLRGRAQPSAYDHVRMAVYGDSNGTMDFMTGEMRRVFQTKYGPDAGHGFVAVGRPWNWYRHRYVRHDSMKDTWEPFTVTTKPTMDGFYGHALIAGESKQAGGPTWVGTVLPEDDAPIGKSVSRFDVHFLKWWRGGAFDVKIDGKVHSTVDTEQKASEAGFHRVDLLDGPHTLTIVPKTFRKVRIFGVALEREAPGVQVDGLGVGSLNCLTMLRDDPAINKATLARRRYDLVVFHIGSNTFVAGDLATCMKDVIARHRAALPGVPVLVMTPPDFLESYHPPRTAGWMRDVVVEMKAIAEANDAAFFDFRAAMGGDGSMGKFQDAKMTQGDYVHFNEQGGAYMGDRVVYALVKSFGAWLVQHPDAGCDRGEVR